MGICFFPICHPYLKNAAKNDLGHNTLSHVAGRDAGRIPRGQSMESKQICASVTLVGMASNV